MYHFPCVVSALHISEYKKARRYSSRGAKPKRDESSTMRVSNEGSARHCEPMQSGPRSAATDATCLCKNDIRAPCVLKFRIPSRVRPMLTAALLCSDRPRPFQRRKIKLQLEFQVCSRLPLFFPAATLLLL